MAQNGEDQVDETEIQLGRLAKKILIGKNRGMLQKLISEEDPAVHFPEVEMQRRLEEVTSPLQKKIDGLEGELRKRDSLETVRSAQKPLRDMLREQGRSEKEIDAEVQRVEKVMVEKKIGDYTVAHQVLTLNDQIAAPAKPGLGGAYDPLTLPDMGKEFFADPNAGARKLAGQFFQERKR